MSRCRVRSQPGSSQVAAGLLALALAGCGADRSRPGQDASVLSLPGALTANTEDRDELLAELEQLRQDGRYEEGLARVRQSLALSPEDALLHFHLGLLLQSSQDFDEAEAAVSRGLELGPAHYPSYRVLGDLAQRRGAPTEAMSHFERCVTGLPAHAGCRYGLALALIDLGELDAAAEPLTAAAEQLERVDVFAELGRLERRRRRLPEAISAFSRALGIEKNHLPSLLGMGQALVAAGRHQEGRAMLEKHRREAATEDQLDALKRAAMQPGSAAEIHLQRARLYRSRGDLAATESALREALAKSPGLLPATLALANHLLHQGDLDEAEELTESLPATLADQPAVLFLRGTLDVARGDESAALAHFKASAEHGAWPPPVYLDAGKAWSRAGFPSHAAAAFERAIAGLPDSAEAHLGLAGSQRQLKEASRAVASLQRTLELDPAESRAWLLLGVLHSELGNGEEAARFFSRGLEARQLDLLVMNGADEIRRELQALRPPSIAVELFDRALADKLPH